MSQQLLTKYHKVVIRIIDPMIVSGAFIGGYSGMYMAREDHPNNMAKTWFGGVIGAGVGTLTGCAMAWTFPIAIVAAGVKIYDNVKVPLR
jgi:hypothetical protein